MMIKEIQSGIDVRTRSDATKFVLHLAWTQFEIFAKKYHTLRETMDNYETLLHGARLMKPGLMRRLKTWLGVKAPPLDWHSFRPVTISHVKGA